MRKLGIGLQEYNHHIIEMESAVVYDSYDVYDYKGSFHLYLTYSSEDNKIKVIIENMSDEQIRTDITKEDLVLLHDMAQAMLEQIDN
jgi:hypothetical protein